MYIKFEQKTECSKCGAKNFTETVIRDNNTYIRCRKCGHEKLISTLTKIESDGTVYNAQDFNNTEVF